MLKQKLLKFLDASLGRLLGASIPNSAPCEIPPKEEIQRILFLRPGGIGDAVHLIPTIQYLKLKLPWVEIFVLAEKRNAAVFAMCDDASSVLRYDVPGDLSAILRQRFDVVIDTEQWHYLSALVARFVKAKVRIGYATNQRMKCFHYPVAYSHERNETESFSDLITPLLGGTCFRVAAPYLDISPSDVAEAKKLLGGSRDYVAIFPGASIPERRWGGEKFREVAAALLESGYGIVVVGGHDVRSIAHSITRELSGVVDLTGKTSIAVTAAVLSFSKLLLSGDSGVLHLAVGLNVPAVALFGPGIKGKWAPSGDSYRVLDMELECSPCTRFGYTPKCSNGVQCMVSISPDLVKKAVFEILEKESGEK